MEEAKMEALRQRIWITAKSRMYAEKRFRTYDVLSHIYLCFLSFIAICLAVFSEFFAQIMPLYQVSVVVSVFIFGASIVIFGFSFGELAVLHKQCYIRLQEIESDYSLSYDHLHAAYSKINSAYPNHSTADYEQFILERTLLHGRSVGQSFAGTGEVNWTSFMLVKYFARWFGLLIVLSLPFDAFWIAFRLFGGDS